MHRIQDYGDLEEILTMKTVAFVYFFEILEAELQILELILTWPFLGIGMKNETLIEGINKGRREDQK